MKYIKQQRQAEKGKTYLPPSAVVVNLGGGKKAKRASLIHFIKLKTVLSFIVFMARKYD